MDLIIVQHFYDLPELTLARRGLEAEGIKTVSRDENTMQTLSVIEARAVGGAKLLVDKSDYARASKILIDLGIMNENNDEEEAIIFNSLNEIGSKIPFVSKLPKELQVVSVAFLFIAIPFLIVSAISFHLL